MPTRLGDPKDTRRGVGVGKKAAHTYQLHLDLATQPHLLQ